MKHIITIILASVFISQPAFSLQIYRWKDKDGNIVVSSTPPPPGTEFVRKESAGNPSGGSNASARNTQRHDDPDFKRPYKDIKVIMYVTEWCPVCHKARAFLKSLGVTLVEHDVEKDDEKAQEWLKKVPGRRAVPLIDIEGVLLLGLNPAKIRAAIEEKRTF
jgi:glutaredoxin